MSKAIETKNTKKVTAKNKGARIVKFKFKNYEVRGGDLSFFYGDHETPDSNYHFQDGGVYEAPYSVAEHIHFNTSYPIHHYKQDDNGKYVQRVGETVQRYGIIPMNFIFEKEEPSNLVTVEYTNSAQHSLSL